MDDMRAYNNLMDGLRILVGIASCVSPSPKLSLVEPILTGVDIIFREKGIIEKKSGIKSEKKWKNAVTKAIEKTRSAVTSDTQKKVCSFLQPILTYEISNITTEAEISNIIMNESQKIKKQEGVEIGNKELNEVTSIFLNNLIIILLGNQDLYNIFLYRKQIELEELSKEILSQVSVLTELIEKINNNLPFIIGKQMPEVTTPFFTGREYEIHEIISKINNQLCHILISGMGGMGKTQILLHIYLYYYSKKLKEGIQALPFTHMGFFTYQPGKTIEQMLYDGMNMERELPDELEVTEKKRRMWSKIDKLCEKGLTIFIDNIPPEVKPDELKRLSQLDCSVVITSRRRHISGFSTIYVERMPVDDCVKIFRKINDDVLDDEDDLLRACIIDKLDRHTLTISLMAHISKNKGWSIKKLVSELNRVGFSINYLENGNVKNILQEYKKLYTLEDLSSCEKNILEGFSLLSEKSYTSKCCQEWLFEDSSKFTNSFGEDVLYNLCQKGWLESGGREYRLHVIFSEFIKSECKPKYFNHKHLVNAVAYSLKFDDKSSISAISEYIPTGISILEYFADIKDIYIAQLALQVAKYFCFIQEYREAIKWGKKAYLSRKYMDQKMLSECLYCIGKTYFGLGEYTRALDFCIQSLKLDKASVMQYENYELISIIYRKLGLYSKSLKTLKKSLMLHHRDNLELAKIYLNLEKIYFYYNDYSNAFLYLKKSKELFFKELKEENYFIAEIYYDYARLKYYLNEYTIALDYYSKALNIYKTLYGEKSFSVASTYNNIALVYAAMKNDEKARCLYKRCISIISIIYGAKHHFLCASYFGLGKIYIREGKIDKGLSVFRLVLDINSQELGENHPNNAIVYIAISEVYYNKKKYAKALQNLIRAYYIQFLALGKNNKETLEVKRRVKKVLKAIDGRKGKLHQGE